MPVQTLRPVRDHLIVNDLPEAEEPADELPEAEEEVEESSQTR